MPIFDDTRADWNARPPTRPRTSVPWVKRLGVSWHWIGPGKGPSASGPHSKCLERVRAWQRQHQTRPGDPWKDIGYNALVCQHGRAIEGRGLEFSGSHSPGVNVTHVGIQFMRGSGDGPPGAEEIARAQRLRADVGALGPNIARDWPHRDDPKASTACPGDWIANAARSGLFTRKPAPTAPTAPLEDDDMQLTDKITVRDPETGGLVQVPLSTVLTRMSWTYDETRRQATVLSRQAALLNAIAAKILTADEIEAAAQRGAQVGAAAALDERITSADVTLEVQP